jgi:biopolymer transport protein ExbB/TolQ
MLLSPLFTRYSKGPEHAYDANLRRRVLDQARAEHAQELARGLAWLDSAATEAPLVGEALAMAGGL